MNPESDSGIPQEVPVSYKYEIRSSTILAPLTSIKGDVVKKIVASYSGNERFYYHPKLMSDFDQLDLRDQAEIIKVVKPKIWLPERIADSQWQELLGDEIQKNKITLLREAVTNLQVPGESYVFQRTRKKDKYVPESDDGYLPALTITVSVTDFLLVVGARETDRFDATRTIASGDKNYAGGKKFTFASLDTYDPQCAKVAQENAEAVKVRLLDEQRVAIQDILIQSRDAAGIIPDDQRLYDLSPEDWLSRYQQQWNQRQKLQVALWQDEEQKTLQEFRAEWDRYEAAATTLRQARHSADEVARRAQDLQIDLGTVQRPHDYMINIGADTLQIVENMTASLDRFVKDATEAIEGPSDLNAEYD
ncbi:MAG: hypothetical protein AAB647_00300 [Patescibacteria group bacterium]